MSEGLVYTGVWLGELVEEGNENKNLFWSLVLVSDSPYPRDHTPNVLHGKWDNKTKVVEIKEIMPENGGLREFSGFLTEVAKSSEDEKITIIKGTWKWGNRNGQFICCKESDKSSNISGFWIGLAKPSKKLADFCIPTNPIRWCLTLLPTNSKSGNSLPQSTPSLFGSGFFDDSGDVPGKNLLFYTLRGSFDVESGKVQFTKEYEHHHETTGYEVSYSGVLGQDGFMRGKWENKKGGSFGKWMCRQQTSSPKVTSSICICDKCDTAIKPGEIRWACASCPTPWFCCGSCAREDLTKVHEHPLLPEGMYYQDTAQGVCCAEIAWDALTRFGKREFIGWRLPNHDRFTFLTYDDVAWHTKQIVFGLREIGCQHREFALICADLSTAYLSVVLSCIIEGLVIVPVHGCLVQSELEHIIQKTNPSVCFVSTDYFVKVAAAVKSVSPSRKPKVAAAVKSVSPSRKPIAIEITRGSLVKPSDTVSLENSSHKVEDFEFGQILSLDQVREKGRTKFETGEELKVIPLAKQDVSAVLFTSGSTGVPKGADLMMPSEGVANVQPFVRADFQSYDPSFSLSILQTMLCGGSRLFCLSLDTILQDFQKGRPTHIGATPILWNALYQEYLVKLSKEAKINETLPENSRKPRNELSNKIVGQVRSLLGNRLMVATSGGAPISPEVLSFLKTKLRIDIIDLYGSRETGGITRDGIVYPSLSIKLLDPDLGYFSAVNSSQGEICVHSPRLISGYWNEENLTKESFIEFEGKKYYRTGDIGEMHETIEPNGKKVVRLKVIDRVSSIMKLSAGEWLSFGCI